MGAHDSRRPRSAARSTSDRATGVAPGERLLAVHVLARSQGRCRHIRVGGRDREIDDRVDLRVVEQLVERRIVHSSEPLDESCAQRAIDVGRACDPHRRIRADRLSVRPRDVPAADDGDAERVLRHGRPVSAVARLLPDEREPASALVGRVAVERLVLDAHRAGVVDREERVDAVGNLRAAFPVHARDVRARLLDVLQMHVEEAVRELVDRVDRVVSLRRPPARVDRRAEHVVGVSDRREHLFAVSSRGGSRARSARRGARSTATAPSRSRCTTLADAGDQIDIESVREAARGCDVVDCRADASGEAGDTDGVTIEGLTRARDMFRGGPAPVEMAEPEIDRVEPDPGDPREESVEARREALEWLERRVRRDVERSPFGRRTVSQFLGHVVRAHEREREGSRRHVRPGRRAVARRRTHRARTNSRISESRPWARHTTVSAAP